MQQRSKPTCHLKEKGKPEGHHDPRQQRDTEKQQRDTKRREQKIRRHDPKQGRAHSEAKRPSLRAT